MIFLKRFFLLFAVCTLCGVLVAQESYYTSIDGIKGGEALKTALYELIRVHERISYGSGSTKTWGAFYSTDRNPANNQVYDMYSPTVRYFGSKGSVISGMNIEHSVAKSWWGGDENDAYCDLHHLNPSDQDANSRKSNYPMAELESVSWDNEVTFVGKATIDGSSMNAFEPCDEYKGDFARTFMYMFTCYQNLTYKYTWMNYKSSTYPTLKPWAVELLLKWSKQDPVSEKEIARNNAVYAIQGNRNPYIDYPQLAEYVWGDSVNYTFNLSGAVIGGGGTDNTDDNTFIMESFSSDFGKFTLSNVTGEYPWSIKYGAAYVTAYVDNVNNAAESWLVSPSMDFSAVKEVKISFDYVTKYNESGKVAERNQLLISSDYNGDVSAATWKVIDFSVAENSSDWAFTSTGDILVPAEYLGKSNVTIAFKYTSTTAKAGTWNVKNLLVAGVPGEPESGDDTGDGDDTGGEDTGGDDNTENSGTVGNNGKFEFENFHLVKDAADLTVGDSIIFVYDTFVMGEQSGNYRTRIEGAVIAGDSIISYPVGTQKILLEAGSVEGSYAFNADGLYLAAVSNSSNYMRSLAMDAVTADASWKITIGSDNAAEVKAQGSYTRNVMQYNTSSPRFSCYTGTQKSVKIYAKSPKTTIASVAGDVNSDGIVDVSDVTLLVSMVLNTVPATEKGDIDGSGTVDVADVTAVVTIILGTYEE